MASGSADRYGGPGRVPNGGDGSDAAECRVAGLGNETVPLGDGFVNVHGYNDRSELTVAERYTGETPETYTASPFAFTYDYDAIGNRQLDGVDWDNWAGYARNALNQYTRVTRANELLEYDLDGNMTASGLISSDIDLDGDVDLSDFTLFSACFNGPNNSPSVGNPPPPSAADCNRADADGDGDVDISDYTAFMHCFNKSNQPPACQGDVRPLAYTWDAENRLVAAEPLLATWEQGQGQSPKKLTFAYDYLGRRVEKIVYNYSGGQWNETAHQRFVYDGWNVVLVLNGNASNATAQKYTWGLDLWGQGGNTTSLGVHGDGGIGGLLACDWSGTSYWYVYDANGNVGQIVGADPLELAAAYEYDPYGNALRLDDLDSSGIAWDNPFRFSTKWFDCPEGETCANPAAAGLYYYGYRYYSPRLGRWMSRDPIEDLGGLVVFRLFLDDMIDITSGAGRLRARIHGLPVVKSRWPTLAELLAQVDPADRLNPQRFAANAPVVVTDLVGGIGGCPGGGGGGGGGAGAAGKNNGCCYPWGRDWSYQNWLFSRKRTGSRRCP